MVEWNGDGAGIQDGEVGDYPVGRVFADEQYTVAVLDPANAEQKTGAMRGVAQFTVADRRALAGGFARFERGERAVGFAYGGRAAERYGGGARADEHRSSNRPSRFSRGNTDDARHRRA